MRQEVLYKIVHITDIHLFADANRSLLGVKTQDSFESLINHLHKEKSKPDFMIISGDLSQDGSEESYHRLAYLLDVLKVPIYCTPGNHDNRDMMEKIYPLCSLSLQNHILLKEWQLILLDSRKQGRVEGFLAETELHFLEDCLVRYPDHQAIIFMHHHPVKTGSAWLDNIGLENAEIFWQRLKNHLNVHAVFFGHVHQTCEAQKNGISYYSTPSTCIQFQKNSDQFALTKLPPSYRAIQLCENKQLLTTVRSLTEYIGEFDPNAKGY